jgi:hypothetical protein
VANGEGAGFSTAPIGARLPQRLGVPFELAKKPLAAPFKRGVGRVARWRERILHTRDRQQRGNTRHAELSERHTQLHRGPHPAELTGRITDNGRRSKEVFLEEMVEQVLQAGGNTMIVFAADDGECVDLAIELRQFLEHRRSGAARVFLVHTVEQGEALLGSVDHGGRMAAPAKGASEEADGPDAGSGLAHRSIENCDMQGHGAAPVGKRRCESGTSQSKIVTRQRRVKCRMATESMIGGYRRDSAVDTPRAL